MTLAINELLIRRLLLEGEGTTLDFKKEQYRFVKATDDEKSELLKDVLAFANSWRRSDAFILLGVEEVKGGASLVKGITELLDDAALQQFVNHKTQRPIEFSYRNVSVHGAHVGVIHIPLQERPLYLSKDFGKLKANVVYVRRGSSTAEASIDEIATMGGKPESGNDQPDLDVFFADPASHTRLDDKPIINSLVLELGNIRRLPDYDPSDREQFGFAAGFRSNNRDYYRELASFTAIHRLVAPIHIAISNKSGITAQDVRAEIVIEDPQNQLFALDQNKYPAIPKKSYDHPAFASPRKSMLRKFDMSVARVGTAWIVKGNAEKVQPQATHWFVDPFYLGSNCSQEVKLTVALFADNLAKPHSQELAVQFKTEIRKATIDDLLELEQQRFLASPAFKKYLKEHGEKAKE